MGKTEIGRVIKQVRVGRGETQEVFAARLGISQAAVNKLESGVNEPDKLVCMALAALSSDERREYFLRRAAGSEERLLPLLGEVAKEPTKSGVARVSGLIHTRANGVQEDPRLQILPSNFVTGHTALRFFQIDGPGKMGIIKKGDMVILSRSASIQSSLEPLVKKLVLVKCFQPADFKKADWSSEDAEFEGYYLGFLRVKEFMPNAEERDPRAAEWIVTIEARDVGPRFVPPYRAERYPDVYIGDIETTESDWERIGYAETARELLIKELEVSRLRYKLKPGFEILGEVIGWFRPAAQPSR